MLYLQLNVSLMKVSTQKFTRFGIDRLEIPTRLGYHNRYLNDLELRRMYPNMPEYFDEFVGYMCELMRDNIKKAIELQRYRAKWRPLSIPYMKYKRLHHLSLKTWKSTGLLYRSIAYKKHNDHYIIGINPYARYRNGIKVLDVARYLEYGTRKSPARPLFRPVIFEMRKNLKKYWITFLKEKKGIQV